MTLRVATATISRWIDADTVVVGEIDLGWGVCLRDDPRRQTTHIRLAGVNAPDSRTNAPWYDPALKTAGLAYVNQAYPAGTEVALVSHELDDFGRSLADVFLRSVFDAAQEQGLDSAHSIATDLLILGYVREGDYPDPPVEE